MRKKSSITLLRNTGDVFRDVQRREAESKNKIFFVHVMHTFSLVKSNCRLIHLNIIARVCVMRELRHDYRPIYI
jgi:hypothetical protein